MNQFRGRWAIAAAVSVLLASCAAPTIPTDPGSDGSSAATGSASTADWPGGMSWSWILTDDPELDLPVDAVDVDLFQADAAAVGRAEQSGVRTICYLSAGTFEPGRPDSDDYPDDILGNTWEEWDERYVDIRRLDALGPILRARLDLCASKGFSAVEPDNLDSYAADTGFDLDRADALAFARWLADEAHARGLAIAQKNTPELTADLVDQFDFTITEGCFDDGWCSETAPYAAAGKAILDAEYTDRMDWLRPRLCNRAEEMGISVLLADRHLTENPERCE